MSLPTPLLPKRRSTRRKFLVGFVVALVALAAVLFATWKSADEFLITSALVARNRETLELAERSMKNIAEMESMRRGFLLTGSESLMPAYEKARIELADALQVLKEKTLDRPDQSVRIDRMERLSSRIAEIQKREIEARRPAGVREGAAIFAGSGIEEILAELRSVHFDFEHGERVLLAERLESAQAYEPIGNVVMIVGPAMTFLALGGAGILVLRDVGRRQRAEETLAQQANLLSNIMDAMPDHVFVKDTRGRYIMHNRAHRLYLGLRASESIEGRTVFDFFPKPLAERYHADDLYVIETGAPIRDREEPARPTSPNVAWLATTKMPLRDPSGRVIGVVCVSSDITARKEADEKLKRFAEQLQRSNAELDSFASVASHDLQEPLRKIQAFGDRLRVKCGDELGEQGRDYLARMQNASERMQVLIQDLLKLSRVASRAQPFARCRLGKVVADVLNVWRHRR